MCKQMSMLCSNKALFTYKNRRWPDLAHRLSCANSYFKGWLLAKYDATSRLCWIHLTQYNPHFWKLRRRNKWPLSPTFVSDFPTCSGHRNRTCSCPFVAMTVWNLWGQGKHIRTILSYLPSKTRHSKGNVHIRKGKAKSPSYSSGISKQWPIDEWHLPNPACHLFL